MAALRLVLSLLTLVALSFQAPYYENSDMFEMLKRYWLQAEGQLQEDMSWPAEDPGLGQVGGLAVDPKGRVNVFHRADRVWLDDTFDEENNYKQRDQGPIKQATIVQLDQDSGTPIQQFGENKFYMPHGLTIDQEGNFWLTDVALHQVFKFNKDNLVNASLTLGIAFEPAKNNGDKLRFCKPTDIAVASDGSFFVADGYCNSRIMKFDKDGKFLAQFGEDEFQVPHSLALAEDLDELCVADRENERILCFNAGISRPSLFKQPTRRYGDDSTIQLGRIFSIAFSPSDYLLYAVNGPTQDQLHPQGFTIDMKNDAPPFLKTWKPQTENFEEPHALDVSPDGKSVYVGEIGPNRVWKFHKGRNNN